MDFNNGTLKSGGFQKWFDKSSRLIEWFLHADSNWIIFSSTTNLIYVLSLSFTGCPLYLLRNLVPTGNAERLGVFMYLF